MSQTGVIVHRNKSQMIPTEYLELVLKQNPKGWGAAIFHDNELKINSGSDGDLELFQDTQKTFMDCDITFYFCNTDSALNMDDVPPYVLLKREDGDPVMVGFIEGNFPGFAKEKSSHPPEWHFAKEYMIPKLESYADMAEYDLKKVMEALAKPLFKKELLAHAVSRGVITLVADNGTSLTFNQSDTSAEFPWGWVSNTYGYGKVAEPPKEEKKEKRSMFPSRSTVREKVPSAAIAEVVKPPKTEGAVIKNYTVRKESPPTHSSRKDKKGWYKGRIGYLPKGWAEGIAVDVYVDPKGKSMSIGEVKALGLATVGLPKLQNPEPVKDTDSEHVQGTGAIDKPVSTEILPIMSPKTREFLKDQVKRTDIRKLIDEAANTVFNPKEVQNLEAHIPGFAAQLGLKDSRDFMCLPFAKIVEWSKEREDFLPTFAWDLKNMLIGAWLKIQKLEGEKKEVTTEPVKETPVPAQKKSMFPSRKSAA